MQKKRISFFLYLALTSTCFSMHQLARPALTQASATIATIAPKIVVNLKNCSSNSQEKAKEETAEIKPESIEKILAEIRDELQKQNILEIDHQRWLRDRSIKRFLVFSWLVFPILFKNR